MMETELEPITKLLNELSQDKTVPRNVRTAVIKTQEDIANTKLDLSFRVSSAIAILDEVANDINLPCYSRTQVWNLVSALETLNSKLKK